MTEQRLAAFERTYLEKCAANIRADRNVSRRFFSGAKLRRFLSR
jgi:hypothetical protein